jgi:integrase
MGRISAPWRLQHDSRTGNQIVKFRHAGRQFSKSTGERDARLAQVEAQRIYEEVVSGRAPASSTGIGCDRPVDELGAQWLVAEKNRLDDLTVKQYKTYVFRWQTFFEVVDRITTAEGERYWRARLAEVKRKTVLKELAALRTMLGWAKTHGYITAVPFISSPDRRATGTESTKPHKGKSMTLPQDVITAIIAALPEVGHRTSRRDGVPYRIRDRFIVQWETSLRPGTVDELRVDDYDGRRGVLQVRDEADKARFGRELPLSPAARDALDRSLPKEGGLIFGAHDYRVPLRAAALAAGLPEGKAKKLTPYDFRHSRLTHFGETSDNLVGVMYLAGHKHASTTSIYMHGSKRAAENVLKSVSGVPTGYGLAPKESLSSDWKREDLKDIAFVRKAGVEPARCYPQEPESCASANSATFAKRQKSR